MKREYVYAVQGVLAAAGAFLSSKLGILYPVLCILMGMMVLDYITGMLASKTEAIDHPGDAGYGWSSRRGAKGIIKKVGYLCVIAVAIVVDYVNCVSGGELGHTDNRQGLFRAPGGRVVPLERIIIHHRECRPHGR